MIKQNQHKYSISAMCRVLQLPRSTYYYETKEREPEEKLVLTIIDIFDASHQNYGSRKIKVELKKKGFVASRRKIGRIMKENGLVIKIYCGSI